ncbi:hypothetical protein [Wenxinia saemankumensis]|uniref:Ferrochelatase n=1 Tax=Wenxinia saemankumensis TaxID=1447782 RepID=A0A1M6CM49_9RHOB|nr:hypothetical protein [Wenxinia saemankumensis]SHI61854.1 hypothetical protein SAMN05444417_1252 [Wenxinia saemankumensis]
MKLSHAAVAVMLLAGAQPALAGGFADEIEEQVVIVEEQSDGSVPGWVIPAALTVVLIALATSGADSEDDGGGESGGL